MQFWRSLKPICLLYWILRIFFNSANCREFPIWFSAVGKGLMVSGIATPRIKGQETPPSLHRHIYKDPIWINNLGYVVGLQWSPECSLQSVSPLPTLHQRISIDNECPLFRLQAKTRTTYKSERCFLSQSIYLNWNSHILHQNPLIT
jgi:hypothetical protein